MDNEAYWRGYNDALDEWELRDTEREKLIREMFEELKPGPTGGNDYHDAWQVFGERLAALAGSPGGAGEERK
jgi:hypothetical protein